MSLQKPKGKSLASPFLRCSLPSPAWVRGRAAGGAGPCPQDARFLPNTGRSDTSGTKLRQLPKEADFSPGAADKKPQL